MAQYNFKPGNLIALKLKNFQSYKTASFNFHPNLNFIAGPNGSGKSSISNALALLLGGSEKTIGKTSDIREYVKFGEQESYIEIKIQDVSKPIVIKRVFRSTIKTSTFFLNNKIVKHKEISEVLKKLKIDVNNICNYLPQERVSEFAKATPEELLHNLIEMISETPGFQHLVTLEKEIGQQDQNRRSLDQKQNLTKAAASNLETDVHKMLQREEKTRNLLLMGIKKDWLTYDCQREEYKEKKKTGMNFKELLGDRLRILGIEEAKIRELEAEGSLKMLKENEKLLEERNHELKDFVHNYEEKFNLRRMKNSEIKSYRKREAEKLKKIEELEINIENFNSEIKTNLGKLDKNSINKLAEDDINLEKEISSNSHEIQNFTSKLEEIKLGSKKIQETIEQLEKRRNYATKEDERKLENLKRYHKDTYKAVVYIRKNKDYFKEKIIEPAYLNLKIKDKNYASEIETFLGFQILSSFICKNKDDYNSFIRLLKIENKLNVNVVEEFKNVKNYEVNCKYFGFDGYLIDFVDAPTETLNLLKQLGNFDKIPISKKNLNSSEIFKVSKYSKIAINGNVYEIKRSKYSDDSIIIQNKQVLPVFFNEKVENISNLNYEIEKKKSEQNKSKEIYEEIYRKKETKNKLIDELLRHQVTVKGKLDKFKKLEHKIDFLKSSIVDSNLKIKELREKDPFIENLENEMEKIENDFNLNSKELKQFLKNLEFKKFFKKVIQIKNENKKITDSINLKEIQINDLKSEINDISLNISSNKASIKEIKDKLKELEKDLVSEISNEDKEKIENFPSILSELTVLMAKESAQIEFMEDVNPEIMTQYKENEEEINKIEICKNEVEKNLQILRKSFFEKRKEILEKIDVAVNKVNLNFERFFKKLGIEGKVEFGCYDTKNNTKNISDTKNISPCENWKLNILVKFRESEKLELLKSSYQSGGEKSVSTILFLLSLIQISESPFRLVDEINQGMDPINERKIHNILVDLKETNSQFFIITPKIVKGLEYSESMKVFVLYNIITNCESKDKNYNVRDEEGITEYFEKYKKNIIN